ncbi:LPS export ABC transporter permease LptG [Limibaculum sp. M0105]|uniref:LPS export ABC transporter permease LptG n=1 Tax=Thermohalobaculum xanthum TaxID=2753746 RepID=A0A8J7M5Q7_9RHOB|nr:LPS export ABC transporter permease LptG [Thermohalobaculum xanthum]MBK0398849.1 LPS export ABC transporter permease LptG [Thermohalobaculum xanthum]
MSGTLSLYVLRRFLGIALGAFLAVFALVAIVDLVELMRANRSGGAGFTDLIVMALMRAPSITITAAPFTVLLASMTCFAWFARSSELVVMRGAGVSVWIILAPVLTAAVMLGVLAFAVYNPVASALSGRFMQLEERFFGRSSSALSVSADGLWLRQGDQNGQTVINAARASGPVDRLWDVSIFQFSTTDQLTRRIDARSAALGDQVWRLSGVQRWDFSASDPDEGDSGVMQRETVAVAIDEMTIPTDLTTARIQESFAPPDTISFWKLPEFVRLLEDSGFSSARHRLHWHALLAVPVAFAAMVLVGAAFSMRHVRFGGLGMMALGCVISGFAYFFLSDIARALGSSGAIPVTVAAWAPPAAAVLLALGLLLHFEDG